MEGLRDEVIATHQTRADLLKWKVILIAAIGSVAFGFTNGSNSPHHVLLALMPLVCLYVDTVARHLNLRIEVISAFIRSDGYKNSPAAAHILYEYEVFCKRNRPAFCLETYAYLSSSVLVSLFVLAFALLVLCKWQEQLFLMVSGIIGLGGVSALYYAYKKKAASIA